MKKAIVSLLSSCILLCNTSIVFADNNKESLHFNDPSIVEIRAEVTEYKYRWYDGKLQKRLWSVTYGYWIDDAWSDC